MSATLAAITAGLVTGLAVHIWHRVTGHRADVIHYDAVHRDATPTREVVAEADREYRLRIKAEKRIAQLEQALAAARRAWRPRPPYTPRIPAPSVHRLDWRHRARWLRPWPLAAITEPRP